MEKLYSAEYMRKLLWLCLFFGAYVWMVTTGNEQFVLERGRVVYKMIADWFKDADLDFHVKQKKMSQVKKERHRRWD
jgi:hypothetical protein